MSISVCLWVTKFLCILPVAVARSSYDCIAIRYVILVLRMTMTSCFHTTGPLGGRIGMALCSSLASVDMHAGWLDAGHCITLAC